MIFFKTDLLKAVILLSFVLAVGFLLIILSCALWQNWLPLLVGSSLITLFLGRFLINLQSSIDICPRSSPECLVLSLRHRRYLQL
jgi:hypothetical protein